MDPNRKFYVTPNRILDVDLVGDVQYHAEGSPTGHNILNGYSDEPAPEIRKRSELLIGFKDVEREWIHLWGEEADTAWKNYRRAADVNGDNMKLFLEEIRTREAKS